MRAAQPHCGNCRAFCNAAAYLEQQLPGLHSLSSGYGAVRGDDGLCAVHGRLVSAQAHCARHAARLVLAAAAGS